MPPPPQKKTISLPIVIHVKQLYLHVYNTGTTLSKRNKFGIHSQIERITLECLMLAIDALLRPSHEKIPLVQTIRRNTEVLKHLVRTEQEIGAIKESTYLHQIKILENISMMATGWHKSLTQNRH